MQVLGAIGGSDQVLVFVHSRKETYKTGKFLKDTAMAAETLARFVKVHHRCPLQIYSESWDVPSMAPNLYLHSKLSIMCSKITAYLVLLGMRSSRALGYDHDQRQQGLLAC